ncbi:hypothetical protein [Nocardia thailandica]|uniref:hypothetical protein n=1 Tax=Nocardia thailandica TaxID=257275 RepID=UPI0012F8DA2F|nr:hypothetical protein [Nocardia thailandica]
MNGFSRIHHSGFTHALVAAINALCAGRKTARQVAQARALGPVTVTLRWLVANGYATAEAQGADTVYALSAKGSPQPDSSVPDTVPNDLSGLQRVCSWHTPNLSTMQGL